jgi:hypothetical protein
MHHFGRRLGQEISERLLKATTCRLFEGLGDIDYWQAQLLEGLRGTHLRSEGRSLAPLLG